MIRVLLAAALAFGCDAGGVGDRDGCQGCEDEAPGSPPADVGAPTDDVGPRLDAGPAGPGPLAPRPDSQTCALPEPPAIGELALEPAFPGLALDRPLWLGAAPGEPERIYVVEQGGRVVSFPAAAPERAAPFLERPVSRAGNEEGLLGLAFHPAYAENGRFFVYYSVADPRRSVISELRRADPTRADPGSERVLLEIPQPFGNHNGGDLRFGPDGYLYVALGDGGSAGDPRGNGQDPTTLLGSILRLDVDRGDPECLTPYGIPADNPFAEGRCGGGREERPEIWAYGLRNPWRMSFDRSTGELWAADVGQDEWEEVDIIHPGRNYGWNVVEGEACYLNAGCDPAAFEPPVWTYGHDVGRSITGGFVYRGPDLPELWGMYVVGDYQSGRIWGLRRTPAGLEPTVLVESDKRITSFGEDADGRLYVVTFSGVFELVPREGEAGGEPLPALLSETGCFTDTASHTVAPSVVPYIVNVRLWSDHAVKHRYLALPAGAKMRYEADGSFGFPEGSVLMKTFFLGERRLETRLLRRGADGWNGSRYKWNADQTDAQLVDGHLEEEVAGPDGGQRWVYPSRSECDNCHTREAGGSLGLTVRQLNGDFDYDGVVFNQLAALHGAGYIDLPESPEALPRFPRIDDENASFEELARALLEANCASCHRPHGVATASIDLRATTPLADTGLCDVPPSQGDLGIANPRLLAPGSAERSVLLQRMLRRNGDAMPPLGSTVVDVQGTGIVGAWIQSLETCP